MPLSFFIHTSMLSASLGSFGSFQCKGNLSKHPVYGCRAHYMKQLSPCFPHRHPHSHHSLFSAHLGTNHTTIFSLTSLSPPPGGQQTSFLNQDHQDLGNAPMHGGVGSASKNLKIPGPPLSNCNIFTKLLSLSEPQFPHLKDEKNNSTHAKQDCCESEMK